MGFLKGTRTEAFEKGPRKKGGGECGSRQKGRSRESHGEDRGKGMRGEKDNRRKRGRVLRPVGKADRGKSAGRPDAGGEAEGN